MSEYNPMAITNYMFSEEILEKQAAGQNLLRKILSGVKGVPAATKGILSKETGKLTVGERLALRLATIGMIGGTFLGVSALRGSAAKSSKAKVLQGIVDDPDIPEGDYPRAAEIYGVIERFSPSVAQEPTLAKDLIKQTVQYPTIPPDFVEKLVKIEDKAKNISGSTIPAAVAAGAAATGILL